MCAERGATLAFPEPRQSNGHQIVPLFTSKGPVPSPYHRQMLQRVCDTTESPLSTVQNLGGGGYEREEVRRLIFLRQSRLIATQVGLWTLVDLITSLYTLA